MVIENPVSNDFLSTLVHSINIFDCRLPSVILVNGVVQHFKEIMKKSTAEFSVR